MTKTLIEHSSFDSAEVSARNRNLFFTHFPSLLKRFQFALRLSFPSWSVYALLRVCINFPFEVHCPN